MLLLLLFDAFKYIIIFIYGLSALFLFVFGYNCYYYLYLFLKNKNKEVTKNNEFLKKFYKTFYKNSEKNAQKNFPMVTTQLPIFNEKYVIARLISSVVKMDYPKEKHEIQILDDSNDETSDIIKRLVFQYRKKGVDIHHVQRSDRKDFKAGALEYGTSFCKGDFIAIFDSDFTPPKDFLKKTIPFLLSDKELGFVQTRWGHINPNQSLLTKAQSIGIDGHFIIEQSARCWGNLFLNFNGTAGIWRKNTIIDAGGWQGDTLTEDMDLSYRAQLRNWKAKFLYEVVCEAELPANINDFKSQQFRWAKGSIQTAKKLLPKIN